MKEKKELGKGASLSVKRNQKERTRACWSEESSEKPLWTKKSGGWGTGGRFSGGFLDNRGVLKLVRRNAEGTQTRKAWGGGKRHA